MTKQNSIKKILSVFKYIFIASFVAFYFFGLIYLNIEVKSVNLNIRNLEKEENELKMEYGQLVAEYRQNSIYKEIVAYAKENLCMNQTIDVPKLFSFSDVNDIFKKGDVAPLKNKIEKTINKNLITEL